MLKRSLLFNLLLALLVIAGLVYLFFSSLNWLTNHGKQTTVPNIVGKSMNEAMSMLKSKGFRIQIDSTFQAYSKPLEVLVQEPTEGENVKVGRTIFITVNRKTPPSIPMPNLVNMSFRNAILTMQSYRLTMGDTTYKPDVAAGAVLEQYWNGRKITVGTMVPIGSKIDLVVASGLSDNIDVPNLIGMSYKEAKALCEANMLTLNPIFEGEITDSLYAIVYMQQPEAINELDFKNSIPQGDLIDVRILQNPSQEILAKNQPGSSKMLGASPDEVPVDTIIEQPIIRQPEKPIGVVNKDSIKRRTINSTPKKPKIDDKKDTKNTTNNVKSNPTKPKTKKDNDTPVKHSGDDISNGFD